MATGKEVMMLTEQAQSVPSTRTYRWQGAAWFVALCMALAAVAAAVSAAAPTLVPFLLALGPAFIAIGLAWRERPSGVRPLLRLLTVLPADRRWYLVLLLPVAGALTVVAAAVLLGEPVAGLFDDLTPAALFIALVVLLPAFTEELGWRGYAVPRLTAVMSPLRASIVLGVPWTIIHLVLLLPGGANEGAALWPSVLSVLAYSVVLTWIFIGTGSVLIAALVHAGLNAVVPIMWGVDSELSWALRAILAAVIAALVVLLGGFRRTGNRGSIGRHSAPASSSVARQAARSE